MHRLCKEQLRFASVFVLKRELKNKAESRLVIATGCLAKLSSSRREIYSTVHFPSESEDSEEMPPGGFYSIAALMYLQQGNKI